MLVAQPADQASNFYFDVNNGQASKVRLVGPVNSIKSPTQLARESGASKFVKSAQTDGNDQAFFSGSDVAEPPRPLQQTSSGFGSRFQDQSLQVTEPGKTSAFSRPQSPPLFKGKVRRVLVVPSQQRQATKDIQQEQNNQVFEENTQKSNLNTKDDRQQDQVDFGRKQPVFFQKSVSKVEVPKQQSTKQSTSTSAAKTVTNKAPFRQQQQFTQRKSSFQSSSKSFTQQQRQSQLFQQQQQQLKQKQDQQLRQEQEQQNQQQQQAGVEEQAQQVPVPLEFSQDQVRVEENPQQLEVQSQQKGYSDQRSNNNVEDQFKQQQQTQDDNSQLEQTPVDQQDTKKEHREQHMARFESKSVILDSDGKTEHEVKREQARQYNIKSNNPQQSLYTPNNYKPKFVTQPRCVCYP